MQLTKLKSLVKQGDFTKTFIKLYPNSKDTLQYQTQRYLEALQFFENLYPATQDVAFYSAPGRTELGGNHTDHNLGVVLAAAVNLDVLCIAGKNNSNFIRIYSKGFGQLEEIDCADITKRPHEEGTTQGLIRGICAGIQNQGGVCQGFDAYITSDVLVGSGLSSSAAFEVAIGTIINHQFCQQKFSAVEIAQISQYAENVYFGKPSGLMDQTASSVGSLITIDFQDKENPIVSPIDFDLQSYQLALCVIDSGGSHADLTAEYASIKQEMCMAAQILGKEYLGQTKIADFIQSIPEIREKAGDRAVLRGLHFYMECQRAVALRQCIEKNDIDGFLAKIIEGGHSSFEYNQNAYPINQFDYQPVSLALSLAQFLLQGKRGAWRLQGGGFAGTIQCFVDYQLLDEFNEKMEAVFGKGACHILTIRNYGAIEVTKDL